MVQRSPARGCLRRPSGPDISYAQPFGRDASRVAWPLTLPVALPFRPGFTQFGRPAPRTLSTGDAPTSPLSRPEVPSAYESPPPLSQLSLGDSSRAAAGTSALPPRPSVRHAFTRRLYALDPITLPAIHRSSRATCRSSTSAIVWTHEHNLETSRPRCFAAMASHRTPGDAALARRRLLSCHGSGVTPSALTPAKPPRQPPSPSWIYPKPIDSDTSCCSLTPSAAWIGPRTATVRTSAPPDPLRDHWKDQLAGAHRTPEGMRLALQGRLPPPLTKAATLNRTQGAFHPLDPFTGQQLRFHRCQPRLPARFPPRPPSR
jgi:hypothetical protein